MYKKRFAKWGFQKNTKRYKTISRSSDANNAGCGTVSPADFGAFVNIPRPVGLPEDDRTTLMILISVKTWSASFFASMKSGGATPDPIEILTETQLRQFKTKEANYAFKLVIDLLDRGHGALAGRMARKAFLLTEDMLTLEGPALVWNLFEMMHYMVTGHAQLFQILLNHLIALAHGVMPGTHPFIDMLRGLQRLVVRLTGTGAFSGGSLPSPSTSCTAGDGSSSSLVDPRLQTSNLPAILKQAWTINADLLLDHFDPRLFPLYFRILYPTWDTCTIPAPARVVNAAKQWFCSLEAKYLISDTTVGQTVGHHAVRLLAYTLPKEDTMLESLLTPLTVNLIGECPQIYKLLRANSLAAVQEGRLAVSDRKHQSFNIDSTISMRMLAVLATAKVVAAATPRDCEPGEAIDAEPVIEAIKTLIELNTKRPRAESEKHGLVVDKIRAIVTLRGYAEGQTDPQVVREMWMLQDALAAAGRHDEAREVERDAYRRMERYIEHIPVDSA
jgi:hypothetical protein